MWVNRQQIHARVHEERSTTFDDGFTIPVSVVSRERETIFNKFLGEWKSEQVSPIGVILFEASRYRRLQDFLVELVVGARCAASSLSGVIREEAIAMVDLEKLAFDAAAFMTSAGLGRRIIHVAPKQPFFSQGDPADCIFYLQKGSAKVTVVSQTGKEATITLLAAGEFVGEEALASVAGLRLSTATATTPCTAIKIKRDEMIRGVMHEEHDFSDLFMRFLLARSIRIQADLVDQLFNSSEKRLARVLLLMAEFGQPGEPENLIPKISQETLAEMIGTT